MFKIDSVGATPSGEFQPADTVAGTPATRVSYEWLNAVQRELINVLVAAGITPSKANDSQLATAITTLIEEGGGGGGGVEPLYEVQSRTIEGATSAPTVYVRQTKLGKFVNITVSECSLVTKDQNNGPIAFEISEAFRPESHTSTLVAARVNNIYGAHYAQITSTGKFQLYMGAGGDWIPSGTTNIGWSGNLTISYSLY